MNQQTLDARRSRQALLAGSVGNFIEWYEFGVYGFLATVIAANFFTLQGENEITSLILTYAAFALAFSAGRSARSSSAASAIASAAGRR